MPFPLQTEPTTITYPTDRDILVNCPTAAFDTHANSIAAARLCADGIDCFWQAAWENDDEGWTVAWTRTDPEDE